jgi:uncharacterized protein YceH (UPF0502 family)
MNLREGAELLGTALLVNLAEHRSRLSLRFCSSLSWEKPITSVKIYIITKLKLRGAATFKELVNRHSLVDVYGISNGNLDLGRVPIFFV